MGEVLVSVKISKDVVTFAGGSTSQVFSMDQVSRVFRIEYGGDLVGPARNTFWIFDLCDSAVVSPNVSPKLRRGLLNQLSPAARPAIRWFEGSCFFPPKIWCKPHLLLAPDRVTLKKISSEELADTLKTFVELHEVQTFQEEGL